MANLFKLTPLEEALEIIQENVLFETKEIEEVGVFDSLGRVLAEDIVSDLNVPDFHRSTMDGFAVKATDTFGSSESMPAMLQLNGEVFMGQPAKDPVGIGQAVRIPTGGMLPEGADAVLMVEYTETVGNDTVLVFRPVAPGENVVRQGEDIALNETVIKAGSIIRPQDIGAMAGVGVTRCKVFGKPKVGIISTGDEIVPPDVVPGLGQVRDINSFSIGSMVRQTGGQSRHYGIIQDCYDELKTIVNQALQENDIVVISGGSSVGTRDVTARVIDDIGDPGILIHGVSVKPGKPTIFGVVQKKPVLGLPGHPASAMVLADLFLTPMIRGFLGLGCTLPPRIRKKAKMGRSIASTSGRTDFIRVTVTESQEGYVAEPVLGKSSLIRTMVQADGIVIIPTTKEGIESGEEVEVILF